MKSVLRTIAIAAFCTSHCAVASTSAEPTLVGLWKIESASFELPDQCKQNGQYQRFSEDGTSVSNDGTLVTRGTYRLSKAGAAQFLYTTVLSDNGQANCQGLSAKYVRRHQPKKTPIPIRFIDNGKRVLVFLGENEAAPHIRLVKLK